MLNRLSLSRLFVGFCAVALSAETFMVFGAEVNFIILAIVFLSTWFVYNGAGLRIIIHKPKLQTGNIRVALAGSRVRIIAAFASLPVILILLSLCEPLQIIIFLLAAMGSVMYMMPVSINGVEMKGLRNRLYVKNIMLSFTWAVATVLFPLSGGTFSLVADDVVFIFLRHFCLIYALTVVFDIPDMLSDKARGFKTIALSLGERKTRWFAFFTLLVYVILTLADSNLSHPVTVALLLSVVFAAIVIYFSNRDKPKPYFTFMVDGSMVVQFALVFIAYQLW